jgi:23S rRNA (guanosine2251-2'-O)-methyltransferase
MKEYIYGKNTVREALNVNNRIIKLNVSKNNADLIEIAKKKGIKLNIVDNNYLNKIVDGNHQGAVLEIEGYSYVDVDEIISNPKGKYPFIVMLDGLEDPHNLGAILRTCDAGGVDGVIIGKNRSVHLNNTVAKVSTGAIEHVKVSEVTNLTTTIKYLKKQGYWIVGAEACYKSVLYTDIKYDMPVCLVIGSEGKGISRLVTENSYFLV